MPRALVRVVGSDSGALSLTAVQAAVTKKTKAASAFAFASFATASFEEVERTEGVAQLGALVAERLGRSGGGDAVRFSEIVEEINGATGASAHRLFLALLWAASQHNQAQLEGEGEAARRAPLPLPAGHEVRLEAVEGSGGRDLAAVLEAAE